MPWHTNDEGMDGRLEEHVQTRSGLTPVSIFASQLSDRPNALRDLSLRLIRGGIDMDAEARAVPERPEGEAELRDAARDEVSSFFGRHANSYLICYYIAIAVYEGQAYGDVRRFAEALWTRFQEGLGGASAKEMRGNAFISVNDILARTNAEMLGDGDADEAPWARTVRFRNPFAASACIRSVAGEYPLLADCLLDACVAVLGEQEAPPCGRVLIEWADWDYPSVNRRIESALGDIDGDANQIIPSAERLLAVQLEAMERAAGNPKWSAMLCEAGERLWRAETANLRSRLTPRALKLIRILAGGSRLGSASPALLTACYFIIRECADDWRQRRPVAGDRWGVLLYAVDAMGKTEALWHEMVRLLNADIASRDKELRVAGYAALTLLLYADCLLCLLSEGGRPLMGILAHCSSKRAHTAETAALLRGYCERNGRFLCLETILDEQLTLMDVHRQPFKGLWPFVKWMAFTQDPEDYERWHDYLKRRAESNRYPSETAAGLVAQMEKIRNQAIQ